MSNRPVRVRTAGAVTSTPETPASGEPWADPGRSAVPEPLPYRLTARIETWPALDGALDAVSERVRAVPKALRDALHGKQAGHPLHPVAVLLPTGAWMSASVLDAVPGTGRAARTLVGVGVLAALPAVAAGLVDWSMQRRDQQRVGGVHAMANTAALALYSLSWLRRRRGASGVLPALLGLGLISAGGYLGGHMTYRRGVGVESRPDLPA
ncbi:MAG: DUF2231 domain-containing protein [Micrococcales bacterium]|nr:DUF2231 domain-containing protein [Micrococcales bacterium]